MTTDIQCGEIKIFLHHIYELKKGVRHLVLCTISRKHEKFIMQRLESQNIEYSKQYLGNNRMNLFFGKRACLNVISRMIDRPLNELTPEEDFILGTLLGYDICQQCERFCGKKPILKTA